MLNRWYHWTTLLAIIAIGIIIATIFYSSYLSGKLAHEEKQKVETWVEAQKAMISSGSTGTLTLATHISASNDDIPIIETNERDSLTNNYLNIDSNKIKADSGYLSRQLKDFKKMHAPILLVLSEKPFIANKYYYGESQLQKEVRYYPLIQLIIFIFFIVILFLAQRSNYRSVQNKMWVGMAKETAHQLGTPVSSLQGWIEVLREQQGTASIANEMEKDVMRLQLVSDRFGKIGAHPQLEKKEIESQVKAVVEYIKKRAGKKTQFHFLNKTSHPLYANISAPLFDWVVENLLKNGLDAMGESGKISVILNQNDEKVFVDVQDSGKGISARNLAKVFKPGFTTKKRGWGLGLTLSKRIIEEYHKGDLQVKWSAPGKGTCFRITLNKAS
jgi:signal transduction histidine kinase